MYIFRIVKFLNFILILVIATVVFIDLKKKYQCLIMIYLIFSLKP